MRVNFTVYGDAKPAGSKRAFVAAGRARVVDANPNAKPWKSDVAREAARAWGEKMLLEGPLEFRAIFYRPRPKGHFRTGRNAHLLRAGAPGWPITKPDVLKLARGVEDACTGIVYRDDAQIVVESLEKRWGTPARVEVTIRSLTPEPRP